MALIEVRNLTKDYGYHRGVFDISFDVKQGEVYGFLGPNGAGKTTAIRHIMGFSRPHKGSTSVNGINSWQSPDLIQRSLGYLPGEIALPYELTGNEFIKIMAQMRGVSDMTKTNELLDRFELNPVGKMKRMSLGMKRKLAIVTAFMHDPQILVLDEPTSGLDPLMQKVFIDFIKQEKANGKTILLSSHIFKEVEATCDRIAIIKEGEIVSECHIDDIKIQKRKTFKIEFLNDDYDKFIREPFDFVVLSDEKKQVRLSIEDEKINTLISALTNYRIKFFAEQKYTLEDYFMHFYQKEGA